jgi:uncharacterized protein YbjT (DUF2867 family)
LLERGWAVRGTSRNPESRAAIAAAGIEAVVADPDRVGSIVELVGDVTVVAWLLGSARGSEEQVAALHGSRLERLLEKLVDTPVRGLVYEASGDLPEPMLAGGVELVDAASRRWRIPAVSLRAARQDHAAWAGALRTAVESAISRAP